MGRRAFGIAKPLQLAVIGIIMNGGRDVGCWHKADVSFAAQDVRLRVPSGLR